MPKKWNKTINVRCGLDERGVSAIVLDNKYTIGYMGATEAVYSHLSEARIEDQKGQFVDRSLTTLMNTVEKSATTLDSRLTGSLINLAGDNIYPISGYAYVLIRKRTMTNCTVATEVYRMLDHILEDSLANAVVFDLLKVPIQGALSARIRKDVLDSMECSGRKLRELAEEAIAIENGTVGLWRLPVAVTVVLIGVIGLCLAGAYYYTKYQLNKSALRNTFILFYDNVSPMSKSMVSVKSSFKSSNTPLSITGMEMDIPGLDHEVVQQGFEDPVMMTPMCAHFVPEALQWKTRVLLVKMRDNFSHMNVTRFYGLTIYKERWNFVEDHAKKGNDRKKIRKLCSYHYQCKRDEIIVLTSDNSGLTANRQVRIVKFWVHFNPFSYTIADDSSWLISFNFKRAQTSASIVFRKNEIPLFDEVQTRNFSTKKFLELNYSILTILNVLPPLQGFSPFRLGKHFQFF